MLSIFRSLPQAIFYTARGVTKMKDNYRANWNKYYPYRYLKIIFKQKKVLVYFNIFLIIWYYYRRLIDKIELLNK